MSENQPSIGFPDGTAVAYATYCIVQIIMSNLIMDIETGDKLAISAAKALCAYVAEDGAHRMPLMELGRLNREFRDAVPDFTGAERLGYIANRDVFNIAKNCYSIVDNQLIVKNYSNPLIDGKHGHVILRVPLPYTP